MSGMKKTSPVKLKFIPIAPLFIGTGEIISRAEIAFENNVIYKADIEKMAKLTNVKNLKQLIFKAITEKKAQHQELENLIKKGYSYRMLATKNISDISLELREYIKVNNKLYVPGSSIKGAILSALVNTALTDIIELSQSFETFLEKAIHNKKDINDIIIGLTIEWLRDKDEVVEKYMELDEKAKKELKSKRFEQWLQVSDTNLVSPEKYGVIRIIERKGGSGAPPPILVESLRNNKELLFEMNLLREDQKVELKEILEICDSYYRKQFEEEVEWLKEREIKPIIKLPEKKNGEYLIRVGFGSGNRAISIIPTIKEIDPSYRLLSEYGQKWKLTRSGKAQAQSKWLAEFIGKEGTPRYYPLGWAKIVSKE
ncbi:MAG: type III-A CRISPR-associated RAMP protein Csm5 [Candidatus Heimdallarchaeaceae archaeon]